MEVSLLSLDDINAIAEKSAYKAAKIVLDQLSPQSPPGNEPINSFGWITNHDAIRVLGSRSTLQRHRDSGALPFSKINGKIFYRRSDIEGLLERNLRTVSEQVTI